MNILHVGTFYDLTDRYMGFATPSIDLVLAKGFESNGHQVARINPRVIHNPGDKILRLVKNMLFDLIFFGNVVKSFSENFIVKLRQITSAKIVHWYGDCRGKVNPDVTKFIKHVDVFFHTTGGERLKEYKYASKVPIAAFMFNPCYPETFKPIKVPPEWETDVVFTGGRFSGDGIRPSLIRFLKGREFRFRIYGSADGALPVAGKNYIQAINGAKIGLGVSGFHEFKKYTSVRLSNYMSCGTFYLCQYFNGMEEIFKNKEHLVWFHKREECLDYIRYYLSHSREREQIGIQGMNYMHRFFNQKITAQELLSMIFEGRPIHPWTEMY